MRIPTYESRVAYPTASAGVRRNLDDAAAPGEALASLGTTVAEIGIDRAQRAAEIRDQTATLEAAARMRADWIAREAEARQRAPAGADGHAKTLLEDFDAYLEDSVAAAPSERVGLAMRARGRDLRGDVEARAVAYEATARGDLAAGRIEAALNLGASALMSDPVQYDAVRDEQMTMLAGLRGVLPADQIAQIQAEGERLLTEAAARGAIALDPGAALARLQGGDFGARLSPGQTASLVNMAEAATRHRAAAARLAAVERRAALRVAVDASLAAEMAALGQGQDFGSLVSDAQILDAYGEAAGTTLVGARAAARTLGADIAAVRLMNPAEQDAVLAGHVGVPARRDALRQAIEADRAARHDPAAYVYGASPALRAAFAAATDPGADPAGLGRALGLSLRLQEEAGIPAAARRALTDEAASRLAAAWAAIGAGPAERLDSLAAFADAIGDEAAARLVLNQIRAAGLPDEVDDVLRRARDPLRQVAVERLITVPSRPDAT